MLEKLYTQFLQDPLSVEPTWRFFFEGVEFGHYSKALAPVKATGDLRIYHLIDAYRRFGHLQSQINPIATRQPTLVHELSLSTLNFEEKELSQLFPTGGILPEENAPLSKIIAALQETYCGTKAIEYMGFHSLEMERWLQSQIEPSHFLPHF